MTLTDLFEELYIAIKQDGHDIYFKAEDAEMLKSFIIEYMSFQKLIEYIKDIKNIIPMEACVRFQNLS